MTKRGTEIYVGNQRSSSLRREQQVVDIQRGTRQSLGKLGPEHIGSSQPKAVSMEHENCRMRVRCDGTETLEPMRRAMGGCGPCLRYMGATKRPGESIGAWLRRMHGSKS